MGALLGAAAKVTDGVKASMTGELEAMPEAYMTGGGAAAAA